MDRLVALAVRRRILMVALFALVIIGGVIAFQQLNIEAYPDPTPPMVDIVTQSPGLSSEEIERYITIPIETQVAGVKNLNTIRSISLYGLSDIKLQFSFDYTYDEALQQVLNRLAQLSPLPGNVQPTISPLSAVGEIYRYRLVGPANYSVLDLKTLQDWVLQRRFRAVPGVIDVTGWGGKTKTYELQVDFSKLVAYGLTLPQLLQAVNNSNINVGGNTVNIGSQSAVVRGVGLIRSVEDLADTMVLQSGGNPVLVKDVATVNIGEKPRLGIAGLNQDDDIVEGIVLMRRGEQSSPTIARVEALVSAINSSSILPPGVHIERIYDRKDLIDLTTSTVLHNMGVGVLLIVLLQWIFLGDLRSALIVGATIPAAVDFPRRSAQRFDRRSHDSIRAVFRGHHSGSERGVRQPAVGRRHRFWIDCRCDRHHGRSHFPPPVPDHCAVRSRAEPHFARNHHGHEEPRDSQRGGGRVALDLLCRGDHYRGVPAAFHLERSRRKYFRANGADLRLCAGWGSAGNLHHHAGLERTDLALAY